MLGSMWVMIGFDCWFPAVAEPETRRNHLAASAVLYAPPVQGTAKWERGSTYCINDPAPRTGGLGVCIRALAGAGVRVARADHITGLSLVHGRRARVGCWVI